MRFLIIKLPAPNCRCGKQMTPCGIPGVYWCPECDQRATPEQLRRDHPRPDRSPR